MMKNVNSRKNVFNVFEDIDNETIADKDDSFFNT